MDEPDNFGIIKGSYDVGAAAALLDVEHRGNLPTIQLQFRACFSPECLRQVEMGLKWKRRTVRVNWRVVCEKQPWQSLFEVFILN